MAIENGTQNVELAYLLDPAFQIEGLNGKPVIGGWLNVYEAGTDTKVITYQDFEGSRNPFNIKLGSDGRAVILADPSITYDVYAFDSYGNQIFSRLNVQCNVPGNISIKGADTRIKNTDGTLDISLQTMGNNVREYTVNTRNKLLDVQSPLYFVENSQSATIIGIKGGASGYVTKDYVDSVVSGKLDTTAFSAVSGDFLTDKFEYDDNFNVTGYNGSAFASNGQTYSAGTNIDITDDVISVTGLPTSSDVENAVSSAVTNVENKFEYNENNYITAYNSSAFAGTNYSAGDYVSIENDTINVTGLQPSGDYATHDDLTAYQPSGDYATKTELESATSGKMDVTGMTAYQPSGDYATHDDLTAYQPAGDYYSASNPSGFITNDAITGLQPSGDYATHEDVESAVSGKQDILSAGEGIQIIDNTISVTAQGGSGITAVNHDNTLSGNGNSEPLGLANAEDYVKQDDLTAYATTSLVSSVSSELYSAISGISGDFELVAGSGVELVDDPNAKTTTISVTAQGGNPEVEAEVIAHSADWNTVGDKLDTTAFSDVSGSFLTAVPDTYLQNTDLTIVDNKITEISGVPLSAGDELPSGVMNTSALEYNAVNEISGYNGSAIAQYGAEKQWLVHDDTLVHAANSAQYALGVNLSAIAQLLGVDETVLWSGELTLNNQATLSEKPTNFDRLRFYWQDWATNYCVHVSECTPNYATSSNYALNGTWYGAASSTITLFDLKLVDNFDKTITFKYGTFMNLTGNTVNQANVSKITKIVGIGRKEV